LGEGLVHPADGVVIEAQEIKSQALIQAKGLEYSLLELIREPQWCKILDGGLFMTTYLCPKDYHRVHCPADAEVVWVKHIPGELWPVNQSYVQSFPKLFVTNERVVIGMKTAIGHMVMVLVGATNVGKISLAFDRTVVTNRAEEENRVSDRYYDPPKNIRKGAEVGVFHMGSTVITLFEKGMVDVSPIELLGASKVRAPFKHVP
jgi:phosphatidylserine decarboxylase